MRSHSASSQTQANETYCARGGPGPTPHEPAGQRGIEREIATQQHDTDGKEIMKLAFLKNLRQRKQPIEREEIVEEPEDPDAAERAARRSRATQRGKRTDRRERRQPAAGKRLKSQRTGEATQNRRRPRLEAKDEG